MKAIDLCAGAGGLSLGLARAGFEVLGVERDRVAAQWHQHHVGPCEIADITRWSPPRPVDLVAGGVPCQPFSTQGKREGLEHADALGPLFPDDVERRGQLFRDLVRIAVAGGARAVLLENVQGLSQWNAGGALRAVVETMEAAGFSVSWRVLDAADFGVPQHRRRIFVVGFRDGGDLSWPEPTHGPNLAAPWVTVRDAHHVDRRPPSHRQRRSTSARRSRRASDRSHATISSRRTEMMRKMLLFAILAAGCGSPEFCVADATQTDVAPPGDCWEDRVNCDLSADAPSWKVACVRPMLCVVGDAPVCTLVTDCDCLDDFDALCGGAPSRRVTGCIADGSTT